MIIKLAYNYSTVEMEFTAEELRQYAEEIEIDLQYAYDMMKRVVDGPKTPVENVSEEEPTKDTDVVTKTLVDDSRGPVETHKPRLEVPRDPALEPTPGQIRWAKNLGMKDPEKYTRQEVGRYIQEHK